MIHILTNLSSKSRHRVGKSYCTADGVEQKIERDIIEIDADGPVEIAVGYEYDAGHPFFEGAVGAEGEDTWYYLLVPLFMNGKGSIKKISQSNFGFRVRFGRFFTSFWGIVLVIAVLLLIRALTKG